jgi:endonuclease/exonuclease/phosphatase (EEP) superfamily protein YafD
LTKAPFIAAMITYLFMIVAFRYPHHRWFHIPVMVSCIVFDVLMPVYLVTHRNWWHRLIEQGDITSFGIWMHIGLLVALYALEFVQIQTAIKILKGNEEVRQTHRSQAKALLIIRAIVILTGGILA